jgi:tetratricopeptide (TPR) repeat protein
MGAFMLPSLGQERFKPQDQQVVLAASVHAQGGRNGQLRALDQAWRAQPTNLDASLAYARAVFTLGLTEGDLRWFGSAKAALTPWWQSADLPADGFFLRGLVKQGFHEFDAGLADINQAIAKDAQRAEFWSWRFALHLLLADMAAAQQDILEISRLFGPEEGNVYRGILLYRTGKPQPATELLSAALKAKTFQDTSSQDWIGFHLGEALRVSGQPAQALAIWQKQLKANPQSHLLRLSLAEMLNSQGNYRLAKQIATTESASDALLMQALLASRGLNEPDEKRLASLIDARLKSQEMRQESLIERPKLFYLIAYGKDPVAGLALSIQNWQLQKEPPDALLFIQAALAVNQPRAAEPVLIWAEKTGYTDPELAPLIRQLQSHPRWTGGK